MNFMYTCSKYLWKRDEDNYDKKMVYYHTEYVMSTSDAGRITSNIVYMWWYIQKVTTSYSFYQFLLKRFVFWNPFCHSATYYGVWLAHVRWNSSITQNILFQWSTSFEIIMPGFKFVLFRFIGYTLLHVHWLSLFFQNTF